LSVTAQPEGSFIASAVALAATDISIAGSLGFIPSFDEYRDEVSTNHAGSAGQKYTHVPNILCGFTE